MSNVEIFPLVEGLYRLRVDSLNEDLRRVMQEGSYSRTAQDTSVALLFFGRLSKLYQNPIDSAICDQLLRSLKFLQVEQLQAEHINYLTQGLQMVLVTKSLSGEQKQLIKDFLPKLLSHSQTETYRYNMSDIITMLSGYETLWESQVLTTKDFATVHRTCHAYLENYLHRTKRAVTGHQFAVLLSRIAGAKLNNVYEYDSRTIQRLEQIFLLDTEHYTFSITDILMIFKSFDQLAEYWSPDKMKQTIIKLTYESIKSSD